MTEIRVPTLVVVGREDVYTPVAWAEQLNRDIPGWKLVVIEEAGHMPNLERPDVFNDALRTRVDRRTGVGESAALAYHVVLHVLDDHRATPGI